MRVHPIQAVTVGDEVLRYVTFEFNTPSTHEVTVWIDDEDKPTYAEEVAYGGWYTYDGDELGWLLEYLSDHGIELRDVLEEARKK